MDHRRKVYRVVPPSSMVDLVSLDGIPTYPITLQTVSVVTEDQRPSFIGLIALTRNV